MVSFPHPLPLSPYLPLSLSLSLSLSLKIMCVHTLFFRLLSPLIELAA